MTISLEPLRWLLHPVALLAFAAAAQAWIDGAETRGIAAAVLGVLIAAGTEAARRRVSPVGERGLTTVELLIVLSFVGIVGLLLLELR